MNKKCCGYQERWKPQPNQSHNQNWTKTEPSCESKSSQNQNNQKIQREYCQYWVQLNNYSWLILHYWFATACCIIKKEKKINSIPENYLKEKTSLAFFLLNYPIKFKILNCLLDKITIPYNEIKKCEE